MIQWTTQYFALKSIETSPDPYANRTIDRSIFVAIILSHQNKTQLCEASNLDIDSKDCDTSFQLNEYIFRDGLTFQNISANGTLVVCEGCDLGFPVKKADWTVQQLLQIFGNVT